MSVKFKTTSTLTATHFLAVFHSKNLLIFQLYSVIIWVYKMWVEQVDCWIYFILLLSASETNDMEYYRVRSERQRLSGSAGSLIINAKNDVETKRNYFKLRLIPLYWSQIFSPKRIKTLLNLRECKPKIFEKTASLCISAFKDLSLRLATIESDHIPTSPPSVLFCWFF